MEKNTSIAVFEGQQIRHIEFEGTVYYNLVDVMTVLDASADPAKYWFKVKKKMRDVEGVSELSPIWRKLPFVAPNGKTYQMEAANRKGVLRILMSVPSPKAEPFRIWLAEVGNEYVEETENPELGIERLKALYKAKGYPDEWIERRLQTIEIRKQLTNEWKTRGVAEGQEYSILTAEIAKATFGLTPSEHSKIKGLEKENLRDHMTPLELIFTALGEEATRLNAVKDDAQGYSENHEAAQKGGHAAGGARESFEKLQNTKVVSAESYLKQLKAANDTAPKEKEDESE
jgi:DNA-damage-inducible protein D